MSEIYLAGGCFWGLEKYLASIHGVDLTQVGYANGNTEYPTYEEVCHHNTGHAETVKVTYDPAAITLQFLLDLYYEAVDPVSYNRQGSDAGEQYRTGIYYVNKEDAPAIKNSIARLQGCYSKPIAIELLPLRNFSVAEEYHQKYLEKNPGGYCHIGKAQFEKAAKAFVNPDMYPAPDVVGLHQKLTPEQYEVTQHNATEPPFKNEFYQTLMPGIYVDITTGEPLFSSSDKFESGCGWPSFSKPIDPYVIHEKSDFSYGMKRTEIRSRVGNAHLGHVFPDGPEESGGLRYCINSASLRFVPKKDMESEGYGFLLSMIE